MSTVTDSAKAEEVTPVTEKLAELVAAMPSETEEKSLPSVEDVAGETFKDGSKIDAKIVGVAMDSFVTAFESYWVASKQVSQALETLGKLLMDVRMGVIDSNGKPDVFGATRAYRAVFADRILPLLTERYGMTTDEARELLNRVRTNYVATREMVAEAIIAQAVKTGDIKNATRDEKTGEVTITTPAGNIQTYKPGQTSDVPAAVKNVVKSAFAKQTGAKLKPRFGGAAQKSGGRNEETETAANPAAELRSALETMSGLSSVAPTETIDAFWQALTAMSDAFLGAPDAPAPTTLVGGKTEISERLAPLADLLHATGAVLAGQSTKEERDMFRWSKSES